MELLEFDMTVAERLTPIWLVTMPLQGNLQPGNYTAKIKQLHQPTVPPTMAEHYQRGLLNAINLK